MGSSCPPVRDDIVTPRHLFLSLFLFSPLLSLFFGWSVGNDRYCMFHLFLLLNFSFSLRFCLAEISTAPNHFLPVTHLHIKQPFSISEKRAIGDEFDGRLEKRVERNRREIGLGKRQFAYQSSVKNRPKIKRVAEDAGIEMRQHAPMADHHIIADMHISPWECRRWQIPADVVVRNEDSFQIGIFGVGNVKDVDRLAVHRR